VSLAAPSDDYDAVRERLSEIVGRGLDLAEPPACAADLELIALELARPFVDPELPAEAARMLAEALAERGDELAAGILVALERLTSPPLSLAAAAAASRLSRAGVCSPYQEELGTLEVEECYSIRPGRCEHEILGALLSRGGGETQAALVFVAGEAEGDRIVDGELTHHEPSEGLRAMLRSPDPSVEGRPIEAADCALRLCGVLEAMVERGLELPAAALAPVLVLQRALAGDPVGWPRPFVASAHAAADERAEDELRAGLERLVEAFELSLDWRGGDPRLLEYASLAAHTLCCWKLDDAEDRRLVHWRIEELADFLLEWYPREGDSRPALVQALPSCLEAFFCFLDRSGRLDGDPIEQLLRLLGAVGPRFLERALDDRNWSPTKRLVAEMRSDGVDTGNAAAVAGWIEEFNSRSFAERDRVVGPALAGDAGGAAWSERARTQRRRRGGAAARRRRRR
jgi:hypothetical protein